jgi:hypothetical protein
MRTIGDPEVGSLIEQLREESIRVFTIGFGLPTDIDHPLLQGLADATTPPGYTSSQFYDVTTPGFVVADWHPATELQETYKQILADALDLEAAIDPLGLISAGDRVVRKARINGNDRKVSVFLSWATPKIGRLGFTVSRFLLP